MFSLMGQEMVFDFIDDMFAGDFVLGGYNGVEVIKYPRAAYQEMDESIKSP